MSTHSLATNESMDVLDLREASAYLRLKPRTLIALAARGEVPATKIGKQWRFHRRVLDGLFGSAVADRRHPVGQAGGADVS